MKKLVFLILIFSVSNIQAQEPSKFEFKGYLKDVQNVFIPAEDSLPWFSDNSIENRLQLKYYPKDWLTFDIQARNRFMYGDFVKLIPDYKNYVNNHMGYFDLSWLWGDNKSYLGYSEIDRVNATLTFDKLQITLGRQRINWGIGLVWNPNDIFNTFNYFNFEYEERPGTDAVSIKYYTGALSFGEFVYEFDETFDESSFAGLYRFNKLEYDIQLFAGKMKTDAVGGIGWSGRLGNAAFRGEASYFHPYTNTLDSTDVFVGSVSADYSFPNTLYIQSGFLFNSNGSTKNAENINFFGDQATSPKTLSKGKYNLFAQATGQLTPLITSGIAVIINSSDLSTFISPSITLSLAENFDFSVVGMILTGKKNSEYANIGQLAYLKFKWSF